MRTKSSVGDMSGFKISAGALVGAVKAVAGIVERRTTIPILSHVLLAAKERGLSVSATDLDMQMDATADLVAPPNSPVSFTVDPRAMLAATVNLPRDWPVEVSLRDGAALVSWEWGDMRLLAMPAGDFPTLKTGESLAGFDIGEGALKPLDDVRPCISTEETRYYLNGVYLDRSEDGNVLLVATDGHRMGFARTPWAAPSEASVIAPHLFCSRWAHRFQRTAHRFEFLSRCDAPAGGVAYVGVKSDRLAITSKVIDGKFPEWRRVVPTKQERGVTVSRNALLHGLRAAARFCRAMRQRSNATTFQVEAGRAYLHCRGDDGQTLRLDIGAAMGPNDFWFGVNAPYLIHAAARMEGDEIRLAQAGGGEPVLMESVAASFIVMPLRVEEPVRAQVRAQARKAAA